MMRRQALRHSGRRGFIFWGTYIELCVVVSIIAVLAAILFPVFAKAREKARQASCVNNLTQTYLAISIYARDHAGRYPPTDNDLSPLYPRYLRTRDVFICPSVWTEDPKAALMESYQYRGGLANDALPYLGLMSDKAVRHNEGVNVLCIDGHAKWLRDPAQTPLGSPSGWDLLELPPPETTYKPPPPMLPPPEMLPEPPPAEPESPAPVSGEGGEAR